MENLESEYGHYHSCTGANWRVLPKCWTYWRRQSCLKFLPNALPAVFWTFADEVPSHLGLDAHHAVHSNSILYLSYIQENFRLNVNDATKTNFSKHKRFLFSVLAKWQLQMEEITDNERHPISSNSRNAINWSNWRGKSYPEKIDETQSAVENSLDRSSPFLWRENPGARYWSNHLPISNKHAWKIVKHDKILHDPKCKLIQKQSISPLPRKQRFTWIKQSAKWELTVINHLGLIMQKCRTEWRNPQNKSLSIESVY